MYEVFLALLTAYHTDAATVCRALGVSQSTISNWKTRNNMISADLGIKIASYFDVSLDYLYTGKDKAPRTLSTDEITLLDGFAAANEQRKADMLYHARQALLEKKDAAETLSVSEGKAI